MKFLNLMQNYSEFVPDSGREIDVVHVDSSSDWNR